MRKKIIAIIKNLGCIIYYLLFWAVLSFLISVIIINANISNAAKIFLIFSGTVLFLFVSIFLIALKFSKSNKWLNKIKKYSVKFDIGLISLALLFLAIISPEKEMDDIKSSIAFIWSIIGISIATYIFVHVKYLDIIDNNIPAFPSKVSLLSFKEYVENKEKLYDVVKGFLYSTYSLIASVICTVIVSINVYLLFFTPKFLSVMSNICLILNVYTFQNIFIDMISFVLAKSNKILVDKKEKKTKELVDDVINISELLNKIVDNSSLNIETKLSIKDGINDSINRTHIDNNSPNE